MIVEYSIHQRTEQGQSVVQQLGRGSRDPLV